MAEKEIRAEPFVAPSTLRLMGIEERIAELELELESLREARRKLLLAVHAGPAEQR